VEERHEQPRRAAQRIGNHVPLYGCILHGRYSSRLPPARQPVSEENPLASRCWAGRYNW
jgi:hypothetical protein